MVFIDIRAETEISTQQWQGKGQQMETMLLRYQPLVTCYSRTALKSTFHFTEIANEWKWRQGTVFHINPIYFPVVLGTTYTNFKIFSQ